MRWLRVLLWLTICVSAVLLCLLGFCILWLTAGGLLQGARDWAALAAMGLQTAALLCVTILAACRAEGRWGWAVFLLTEVLATGLSAAFGVNWREPWEELLIALVPLLCAAALAGLNALIERKKETEEHKDEQEA